MAPLDITVRQVSPWSPGMTMVGDMFNNLLKSNAMPCALDLGTPLSFF